MTIYYLYVKTHNITGLKYLGKTEQDPYKYRGSGTRWMNHIKKHGYDVTTEILRECQTNDEVKEWGMYYSQMWDVVKSYEWANLKPEEGDGFTSETAKEIMNRPEVKAKCSDSQKKFWGNMTTEEKDRRSDATKKFWENLTTEEKNRRNELNKEAQNRPEVKSRKSSSAKESGNRPEVKAKQRVAQREAQNRPEVKAKKSDIQKKFWENMSPEEKSERDAAIRAAFDRPESRSKQRKSAKIAQNRPEVKAKKSVAQKDAQNRPEVKARNSDAHKEIWENMSPEEKDKRAAARSDHTIYHWTHVDGTIFIGTRKDHRVAFSWPKRDWLNYLFMANPQNICQGWKVVKYQDDK